MSQALFMPAFDFITYLEIRGSGEKAESTLYLGGQFGTTLSHRENYFTCCELSSLTFLIL